MAFQLKVFTSHPTQDVRIVPWTHPRQYLEYAMAIPLNYGHHQCAAALSAGTASPGFAGISRVEFRFQKAPFQLMLGYVRALAIRGESFAWHTGFRGGVPG